MDVMKLMVKKKILTKGSEPEDFQDFFTKVLSRVDIFDLPMKKIIVSIKIYNEYNCDQIPMNSLEICFKSE